MHSAFGVDHGEISKSFAMRRVMSPNAPLKMRDLRAPLPRPDTKKMTGSQIQAVRSSVRQGKHGMPGKKARNMP